MIVQRMLRSPIELFSLGRVRVVSLSRVYESLAIDTCQYTTTQHDDENAQYDYDGI